MPERRSSMESLNVFRITKKMLSHFDGLQVIIIFLILPYIVKRLQIS